MHTQTEDQKRQEMLAYDQRKYQGNRETKKHQVFVEQDSYFPNRKIILAAPLIPSW